MKIKYLYSSFKQANKKGLLSEYLFYLQLKSIELPQGELLKGTVIKSIQQHYDYSGASISLQLKKLLQAGFIKVYKHSNNKEWKYVICSYRSVWNILGFRFSEYVQRFKFDIVELDQAKTKKALKALIFSLELIRNKQKQNFKKESKNKALIERQIDYHQQTIDTVKSNKIKERKKAALILLKSKKECPEKMLLGGKMDGPIENKISCKRAAIVLGYKTAMVITNLHKKATEMQILSVNKSKSLIATGISKIEFSMNPLFNECYWMFGKVYKTNCNSYFLHNIQNTSMVQDKPSQML